MNHVGENQGSGRTQRTSQAERTSCIRLFIAVLVCNVKTNRLRQLSCFADSIASTRLARYNHMPSRIQNPFFPCFSFPRILQTRIFRDINNPLKHSPKNGSNTNHNKP
jgi:hypothetical protein